MHGGIRTSRRPSQEKGARASAEPTNRRNPRSVHCSMLEQHMAGQASAMVLFTVMLAARSMLCQTPGGHHSSVVGLLAFYFRVTLRGCILGSRFDLPGAPHKRTSQRCFRGSRCRSCSPDPSVVLSSDASIRDKGLNKLWYRSRDYPGRGWPVLSMRIQPRNCLVLVVAMSYPLHRYLHLLQSRATDTQS